MAFWQSLILWRIWIRWTKPEKMTQKVLAKSDVKGIFYHVPWIRYLCVYTFLSNFIYEGQSHNAWTFLWGRENMGRPLLFPLFPLSLLSSWSLLLTLPPPRPTNWQPPFHAGEVIQNPSLQISSPHMSPAFVILNLDGTSCLFCSRLESQPFGDSQEGLQGGNTKRHRLNLSCV